MSASPTTFASLACLIAAGAVRPGLNIVLEHIEARWPSVVQLTSGHELSLPAAPSSWLEGQAALRSTKLFGHMDAAPLWCAVFQKGSTEVQTLQSVLLACRVLAGGGALDAATNATQISAGRFVRHLDSILAKGTPEDRTMLANLLTLTDTMTLVDLHARFEQQLANSEEENEPRSEEALSSAEGDADDDLSPKLKLGLESFERLMAYALSKRKAVRRRKKEPQESPPSNPGKNVEDDEPHLGPPLQLERAPVTQQDRRGHGRVVAVVRSAQSKEKLLELLESDSSPDDGLKPELVEVDAIEGKAMGPFSSLKRAVAQSFRFRSAQLHLPFTTDRLRSSDLIALHELFASSRANERWVQALALSFFVGKPIGSLNTWGVLAEIPHSVWMKTAHKKVYVVIDPPGFVLRAPQPKQRFDPKGDPAYQTGLQHFVVPRLEDCAALKYFFTDLRKNSDPFWDAAELEEIAATELKKINLERNTRLTPSRVCHWISAEIQDIDHDEADAEFFAPQAMANSGSARSYYYSTELDRLQRLYREAHARAFSSSGIRWSFSKLPETLIGLSAGSKGVPDPQHATEVIGRLTSELQTLLSKPGRRSRKQIIRLHNRLVLHVLLGLQWSLGIRSVRDPVELTLLSLDLAVLAVSDKDDQEHSESRIVVLCESMVRQLRQYFSHLAGLKYALPELRNCKLPLLFLLDSVCTPKLVQPATIRPLLKAARYPFRDSSHRHFVRSEFRRRGVSGDDMDALLGHGRAGQRAFSPYTMDAVPRLRRNLGPIQEQVLVSLGWMPLEGLARPKHPALSGRWSAEGSWK